MSKNKHKNTFLTFTISLTVDSPSQVRAPLMQRSCGRLASFIHETLARVPSADEFTLQVDNLSCLDVNHPRRVALRKKFESMHEWLDEKVSASASDSSRDAYGTFSLYLNAAVSNSGEGGVVLVDV
jgi:hypothetical protein